MAYWWIFRMGYTKRDSKQPQAVYKYLGEGAPAELALKAESDQRPHYATLWKQADASDPWGYSSGTTPDWLVGRYGNYWGAQWSGGVFRDFDGVGPTDCRYVDALDRIALEHDIECWIAGEAKRNPGLGVQRGDVFRVQNVYWENGVGPREYVYGDDLTPHSHARPKVAGLPVRLKENLKAAVYLFTLLSTPLDVNDFVNMATSMQRLDNTGKLITLRPDWGCRAAIVGLGLSDVLVTLGDLLRILRSPRSYNIPLSGGEVAKIRNVINGAGRSDTIVRGILESMR